MSHSLYFGNFMDVHKGHDVRSSGINGKPAIMCFTCGIITDIEAIGGHIDIQQTLIDFSDRSKGHPKVNNQPSEGSGLQRKAP